MFFEYGGKGRMKYDFETLINRRTAGSGKWEGMLAVKPDVSEDVVPFSVADMELKNAPEIIEGLKEYLDHTVLGYTGATDAYYEAVINWMEKYHGFRPEKDWFVETPGVVPALRQIVNVFTEPGDSVLIMTPVYYPFRMTVEENGRNVLENELLRVGMRYEIDFADLEEKASLPKTSMMILSSPHNPVGRIWSREELLHISEICLKNHVLVVSDEIHFDLIMPGYEHVSIGTFEKKYLDNTILCTAPSKTFNLAGFQTSNLFISCSEKREKMEAAKGYHALNIMGYKACELAYNKCREWLLELILLIDKNRKYAEDFMAENIPEIKVFPLEGTYLQWWDCRELGMDEKKLEQFMQQKAELFLDEGYIFGEGGKGFERINLACPEWVLKAAMERLLKAVKEYRADSE